MPLPLQVAFHGIPSSDALEARIGEHLERLERHYPRLASCRVGIETVGHGAQGNRYAAHVELHTPGHAPVVSTRHEAEDVYVAVRDAFASAERQLEK